MTTKSCPTEYNSQMNGRHTSATEIKPKRKINSLIICLLYVIRMEFFSGDMSACNVECIVRDFQKRPSTNWLCFVQFICLLPKTRIKYNGFTVCKYLFASIEMRSPGTCECTLMHAIHLVLIPILKLVITSSVAVRTDILPCQTVRGL